MAHEQQVIVNKFPFASTPHWVRHVDPATGAVTKVAGVPVSQNGSWLEGWEGSTTVDEVAPYAALEPRQFFVVAHDGDNSGGRAGALSTWQAGYNTTCSGNGYCLGIDEYLRQFPIPAGDVQHVQDGSWVDTRDSSSDPTWYHWHLPFTIWNGQFADFNRITGMSLAPKKNLKGVAEGATVSFEYGWHYLERNFALLQAAMNYAKTAEQVWLDAHPNHWSPTTALDNQVTYPGNQLNPWMMSYPVKGNASADYAGGANPAELAWYFLLPAMDSGFGYYDENKDDAVKPTLAFNNSLAFSKPYVQANAAMDRTGPSVWWPQRYPYNPGSVNASKAEGWTVQHYSRDFAIYTYGYDLSGITSAIVRVRAHASGSINASDDTYKLYEPSAMVGLPGLSINPAGVGAWQDYPMQVRDLQADMNGVAWAPATRDTLSVLPAQEIGDLYYAYLSAYRNQLLDYYVEMTDGRGNVTRSEIQQVYVGAGTYSPSTTGSGYVEDSNGAVNGVYPFLVIDTTAPGTPGAISSSQVTDRSLKLSWPASTDNVGVAGYQVFRNGSLAGTTTTASYSDNGLSPSTSYSYNVLAYDAAGNQSASSGATSVTTQPADTVAPGAPGQPAASAITSSSLTLTWTAASDNYGVAQYLVLRDGVQVGSTASLTFNDSALAPSTAFNYTIKAQDAAGNLSAASSARSVTTLAGNVATIYYHLPSGWTMANIHYAPTGGTWTTVPGVAMQSACSGWVRYTANLGSASGMQAVFNNGAGNWDNHGGSNYALGAGTSNVENGAVSTGTNPCDVDTTAPSAPAGLTGQAIDANTVSLAWTASTDNIGVSGYHVLRNGVQIASTAATSYNDTGLSASTTYSYAVKAQDAAGNTSPASDALAVTTTPAGGNAATIYYRNTANWSAVNIHYAPNGGNWTVVPGLAMDAACTGWKSKVLALGSATGLQAVFNNGVGTWDNHGGANYALGTGISAINAGAITTANPCTGADMLPPSTPAGLAAGSVSAATVALTWTASTDNVGVTGYKVLRDGAQVGTSTSAAYNDTTVTAATSYSYAVQAYDGMGNMSPESNALAVTTPAAGCQVAFTIANASTTSGQNLYVVGNTAALGNWTPASGYALAIQGSGANVPWSGTLTLPVNTALQYKYVKWNGVAANWESNQTSASGNREMSTPATCNSTISRNDGNFKF